MPTIQIRFTDEESYLKIVSPKSDHHNYGILSRDGQIAVKPELYKLIHDAGMVAEYEWGQGEGKHGGTGYHSHTIDHESFFTSIHFLKRVFQELNIRCVMEIA